MSLAPASPGRPNPPQQNEAISPVLLNLRFWTPSIVLGAPAVEFRAPMVVLRAATVELWTRAIEVETPMAVF